jgi:hypothetical protein
MRMNKNKIIMKKLKVLKWIFTLTILLAGCEELPDPAGMRGAVVVPGITDLFPAVFDSNDLENSFIEFNVNIPAGSQVSKIIIQGSFNDNFERTTITELTTFPAKVRITAADAAQELGIDLADVSNGDNFLFELVTTSGDLTTRSSAVANIPVACAYNVALATGSYYVNGGDWGSAGIVTITADQDDQYKLFVSGLEEIEGLTEDLGPLVMYINPVNYEVTVPKKAIASEAWDYHNIAYEGSGSYNTCDGSFSMVFTISVDEGTFGTFQFSFARNP